MSGHFGGPYTVADTAAAERHFGGDDYDYSGPSRYELAEDAYWDRIAAKARIAAAVASAQEQAS